MTNFSARTEAFLSQVSVMNRDLATLVIMQFGDEQKFLNTFHRVKDSWIDGWENKDADVGFFKQNKEAVLAFLKQLGECKTDDDLGAYIIDHEIVWEGMRFKDVNEALFDETSFSHNSIAGSLACFTRDVLCEAYTDYLVELKKEQDENKAHISYNADEFRLNYAQLCRDFADEQDQETSNA